MADVPVVLVPVVPIYMKANPSVEIGYGFGSAIPACALSRVLSVSTTFVAYRL